MTRYKCNKCFIVFSNETGICPECGTDEQVSKMCINDHCGCSHDIVEGLVYCDVCGSAMCPECNCHDVSQVSRITGYLSDVGGWNAGKAQELKDRHRVSINE